MAILILGWWCFSFCLYFVSFDLVVCILVVCCFDSIDLRVLCVLDLHLGMVVAKG